MTTAGGVVFFVCLFLHPPQNMNTLQYTCQLWPEGKVRLLRMHPMERTQPLSGCLQHKKRKVHKNSWGGFYNTWTKCWRKRERFWYKERHVCTHRGTFKEWKKSCHCPDKEWIWCREWHEWGLQQLSNKTGNPTLQQLPDIT